MTRVQHKLHNFLAIKLRGTISLNTIQTTYMNVLEIMCLNTFVFLGSKGLVWFHDGGGGGAWWWERGGVVSGLLV